MIRNPDIVYKLSFLLFIVLWSSVGFSQTNIGTRSVALGGANTALENYEWALFSNPALIDRNRTAVSFHSFRSYGLVELTDIAAAGSYSTKFGALALGFHRYGDDLYNESRIRLGYKNEFKNLLFGLALNYNTISFGSVYGSANALGLDVGIAANITESLLIGAKSVNVNEPSYTDGEELPRELAIGFSYFLAETALFTFDTVKDVRFPVAYRGGVEIKVIENLKGRFGFSSEPNTFSFGLGYNSENWIVNLAVQKHQLLGMSPGVDFSVLF